MGWEHSGATSFQLLLDAFASIASERSEEAILEHAVDIARLSTHARYGAAATLDPASGEIAVFVHRGLTPAQVEALPHKPAGRGMLGAVLTEKGPIRLKRLQDDPRSVGFPLHHVPMSAFLGVSLRSEDEVRGALYLTKPPGEDAFTERDELFMQALARQTAVALEAARLLAEKDRLNDELQAADRLKDEFMSMTSHELRTPLTSIRAAASMLQTYWTTLSGDRKLALVETIDKQAQRLARLVDNLLSAARLEAGVVRARPEAVAVRDVVDDAVRSFDDVGVIQLDCAPALTVHADRDHLHQILVNYLGNALKYGEPPVKVDATRIDGGAILIRVCDAGPGVPEDFVPRLFERFAQADTGVTRAAAGSGLGLSIVAGLARAGGASVGYQPLQPTGACFTVEFPPAPYSQR